ncbi:MAG: TatD family hydrolase [Synergistaceae bacterium]
MYLTDTHCHINEEYYKDNLNVILQNALNENIKRLIFASADIKGSYEALTKAKEYKHDPKIYSLAGVHPHEAKDTKENYLDELRKIAMNEEVVAIGEIGLDYFYDISPRKLQEKIFREQILVAHEINKPIVLHIRDAEDKETGNANKDTLKILKEMEAEKIGGVVHCFSGDMADMEQALDMGFFISFAGPITYPKNVRLREIAVEVPLDKILCETDSPYLAPQGFRGKTNEPCRVRKVYELIAMLKEKNFEDFVSQIHRNVNTIFKLED